LKVIYNIHHHFVRYKSNVSFYRAGRGLFTRRDSSGAWRWLQPVTLSRRILRMKIAAVVAAALILYELEG
jgi:hypothetical protein